MSDAPTTQQAPISHPDAPIGAYQCSTCRTAWRSAVTCPRCGTELTALMQVAMHAWTLRQAVRTALGDANRTAEAVILAQEACRLQHTPESQRLLALALLAQGQQAAATALLAQLLSLP